MLQRRCSDAQVYPPDVRTRENQAVLFSVTHLLAFSHPACSSHPQTLFSPFKHISLSSAPLPLPVSTLVVVSSPRFLLSLSLSTFNSTHYFLLSAEAPFQLGVCVCGCVYVGAHKPVYVYVCSCVCVKQGRAKKERGRRRLIYVCIL